MKRRTTAPGGKVMDIINQRMLVSMDMPAENRPYLILFKQRTQKLLNCLITGVVQAGGIGWFVKDNKYVPDTRAGGIMDEFSFQPAVLLTAHTKIGVVVNDNKGTVAIKDRVIPLVAG
jgi:hypothetical protein